MATPSAAATHRPAAPSRSRTAAQGRTAVPRNSDFVIDTYPPVPVIPLLSILALCGLVLASFPLLSPASLFSVGGVLMALASMGHTRVPVRPYSAFSHAQRLQQVFLGTMAKLAGILAGGTISAMMLGLFAPQNGPISATNLPLVILAAYAPLGIWFFVSLFLVGKQIAKSRPTCTTCGTSFQTRDEMTALIRAKRCPNCR